MKNLFLVIGLLALVVAAAGQPGIAQNDQSQPDNHTEENETEHNETEDKEDANETEEEMNETEDNETEGPPEHGKSAQFDARLMTAVNTVETLIGIAPNDEARNHLEDALESLEKAQQASDTASLGHGGTSSEEHEDHNHTHEEESEESGTEERGPPGNRGPSRKQGGPPGFVGNLIGGLF